MGNFCASCGAPNGGGKFCPKCGSPQGVAEINPVQPKRQTSVLKIVLISLAVLFVLGVAAMVKGFFFVRDRFHEAKQEIAKIKNVPAQETQAGCTLLSKEALSGILGVTVVRTEGNEAGDAREYCEYFSTAKDVEDADKGDESKDGQADLKDLGSIAKKISAAYKNRPLVSAQIYRGNAAASLIAVKTVSKLSGQDAAVPGPWDEAYFGPNSSTFAVRKGDNGFLLTLALIDNPRETGIAIAKVMIQGI